MLLQYVATPIPHPIVLIHGLEAGLYLPLSLSLSVAMEISRSLVRSHDSKAGRLHSPDIPASPRHPEVVEGRSLTIGVFLKCLRYQLGSSLPVLLWCGGVPSSDHQIR